MNYRIKTFLRDCAPPLFGALLGAFIIFAFIYRPQVDGLKHRIAALETQNPQDQEQISHPDQYGPLVPIHPRVRPAPDNCCDEPVIGARSVVLPHDDSRWHSILFLAHDWESRKTQKAARAMWDEDPWFRSLRSQTIEHVILTDSAEFKRDWQPSRLISMTPCLLIERANGEVIYRESGAQLGTRPRALERKIKQEVRRHCPDGRCLPLHPTPDGNAPEEEIPAVVQVAPEKPAADEKKKAGSPGPVLLLAAAIGLISFELTRGAGFIRRARTAH